MCIRLFAAYCCPSSRQRQTGRNPATAEAGLNSRPLSKPGKGIRFLEFVSLPPPLPSPTGEGAVLRQIQITAAVSHMNRYEIIAIFAANAFPPPVGEGRGGGSRQQPGRFGILSGCRASYGLEGSLMTKSAPGGALFYASAASGRMLKYIFI